MQNEKGKTADRDRGDVFLLVANRFKRKNTNTGRNKTLKEERWSQ